MPFTRPVTEEDLEYIRTLHQRGKTQREIQGITNRGWPTINRALRQLGLKVDPTKPVVERKVEKRCVEPPLAQPAPWPDGWQMQAIDPQRLRAGR